MTTSTPPENAGPPPSTGSKASAKDEGPELTAPPKDRSDEDATGYAVWDGLLARFVSGVTSAEPTNVKEDHGEYARVVRV